MFHQTTAAVASAAAPILSSCSPYKAPRAMAPKKTRGYKKGTAAESKAKRKTRDKATRESTPSSSDDPDSRPRKRTKRGQSTKSIKPATTSTTAEPSAPQYQMPDHPLDNLEGSARLSIHSVFSQRLEDYLHRLEADYNAALTSARAVLETVAEWKTAWETGK